MSVLLARHHRQRRLRDPNRDRAVAPPHDDDERPRRHPRPRPQRRRPQAGGGPPRAPQRRPSQLRESRCHDPPGRPLRHRRGGGRRLRGCRRRRPHSAPHRHAGRAVGGRVVGQFLAKPAERGRDRVGVAVEAGLVGQPRGGGALWLRTPARSASRTKGRARAASRVSAASDMAGSAARGGMAVSVGIGDRRQRPATRAAFPRPRTCRSP